jgi:hypothetical protein
MATEPSLATLMARLKPAIPLPIIKKSVFISMEVILIIKGVKKFVYKY